MGFFTPFVYRKGTFSASTIPIISGMVFDLDARYAVYNDSSATIATNGQSVEQWSTGGAGLGGVYTFNQTTAIDKPTFFSSGANYNNQPYVRFLGTANSLSEYMIAPYNSDFLLQAHTIFFVGRNTNSSLNDTYDHYWKNGSGVDEGISMHIHSNGSEWAYSMDDWLIYDMVSGQTSEQVYVYQMRYEPSTYYNMRKDEGTQKTDTPAPSISYTDTTSNSIGWALAAMQSSSGFVSRHLSCEITRMIVYNRYLSDSERNQMTQYLNSLYNIY